MRLFNASFIHVLLGRSTLNSLERMANGEREKREGMEGLLFTPQLKTEFLSLKHESRILGHSSNPVCGFSMMDQVRLCAVWPMENLLGSSLNQIQGWTTVRESYSHALEQGSLHIPNRKGSIDEDAEF